MGSKTKTSSRAANGGGLIHIDKGSLTERAILKVTPFTPPWLVGAGMVPAAAVTHHLWSAPAVLPWMSIGMTLATATLSALTWKVSRQRKIQGRAHSTASTAFAGVWMTAATITGPTAQWTLNLGVLGLVTLAAGWNIRQVIRSEASDEGTRPQGFKAIFGAAAEQAGLEGTVLKELDVVSPAKAIGEVKLEDGNTADDLQRKLPAIESMLGLPPGSLTSIANLDAADLAQLIVSNPGLLRAPVPYPGPSRPGASVSEPVRVGLGQDAEPAEWSIVNNHTQVMGRSGAAKSFGGFWNFGGEVMSRHDAALFVADLDKGEQTIGPMRKGLHRVELDVAGVQRMMRQFYDVIRARTDHLGAQGKSSWEPGCGLIFLVLWLEEAPSILEHLDEEEFKKFIRTARSAGIHVVLSLQRADFTQMPTFVRGQLSKWCFGVESSHDASFGLTEAQQNAGCAPELWGNKQPGMAYLDALGIPGDRIAIPHRTPMWTVDQMRAHAEAFPATAKPLDPVTAAFLQAGPGGWANPDTTFPSTATAAPADTDINDGQDEREPVNVNDYTQTPDENPDLVADIDTVIEDPAGEWDFNSGGKMPPAQAQLVLRAAIERYRGKDFAPKDLGDVLQRTGMSRGWIQNHLKAMAESGELRHDTANGRYYVRELQPA